MIHLDPEAWMIYFVVILGLVVGEVGVWVRANRR